MAGKIYYRINHNIQAPKLRVIGEDGKQIGVLALSEAIKKAGEKELDLVEIAPKASPPVAKIIDFKKFLYQEEKKRKKEKKRGGETKGIRLTPFIAEADFNVRVKRTKEFLAEGNKVRVEVRFKGRQLVRRDVGYQLLGRFNEAISDSGKIEQEPKWFGRSLVTTVTPVKGSKKDEKEKDEDKKIGRPPVQSDQNR